ncbi:DMT family transporter [Cloacibacterium sp.]|uniref:DMT family transporter n=1 Tax=Cloacibacterium sp. TaxID=1913682 RepID=UPI0039E612DE
MNKEKEKWIILAVLSLIWGSSFILIKKSLEHFSPYQVGALRVLISGILLSPIAILNWKNFPIKQLKWLLIAAFAGNFIPMFLFPIAETKVSSSIAGIMNSMMPIFTIIVGVFFWGTKTTSKQILGILISFFGVVVLLFSGEDSSDMPLFYVGLLLFAAFLYAVSVTTVGAKLTHIPAKMMSSFVFFYVLFLPSLFSLYFSDFFKVFSFTKENMIGMGFVATLSVLGTGLAMMLQYRLMSISNPLFASTVTLLMPIVAVIWGVIDGESFTVLQAFGALIIFAGLIFLRKKKA